MHVHGNTRRIAVRVAAGAVLGCCVVAAKASMDPVQGDPGWGQVLGNTKCNINSSYHCNSSTCAPIVNGSVSFGNQVFKISVTGAASASFQAYNTAMYECKGYQYNTSCQTHGVGCGKFQVYPQPCPGGGVVIYSNWGWQTSCDHPQY